jgi:ring-1,2-phenylacetyl-CoA epoxidase subunit PaaC
MLHNIFFTLHLADDALIMSQRLSEWTGHGPVLEQDIALTNIALDTLGQARLLYQQGANLINENRLKAEVIPNAQYPVDEDDIAYHRMENQFLTHLLVELPNGNWGQTILKLFFFSVYRQGLYEQLLHGNDAQLAAISEKSLKEVKYHVKWSRDWVLRLGDGTEESRSKMQDALDYLWDYTGELFEETKWMQPFIDLSAIRDFWTKFVSEIIEDATLVCPLVKGFQKGGLQGRHTEHIGYMLAEMQYLQRVYPGNEW